MKQQTQPLFTASVASRFVGVAPGTLRRWADRGLLTPIRDGRSRRRLYSWQDIERAQQIRYLVLRRHVRLRAVRPQLRALATKHAPQGLSGSGRAGAPLAPRIALAVVR